VLERPTTSRQWAVLVAVAVGTSVVTYVVFERYLTVLLPRGTWTDW
jgi:putative tricarboxylic transport membrane protein